jgi:glycosyltransferase involved in cell wall biosynthesis
MKNILIVANYSPNFKGNFIASILNLEERLAKEGIVIVYMFPEDAKKCEWTQEMQSLGKTIYFFSNNKIETIKLILNVIKKHDIRILHTHFWWSFLLVGIKVKTFGKVKIIRHFHNTVSGLSLEKNRIQRYAKRIKSKISSFIADMNCGCGKAVYNDLLLYYNRRKCCFVENKIDFTRFDNIDNEVKSKYGFENNIVCMIFANHFYRKGCDIAIKALSPISSKYKIKLIIVCEKKMNHEISARIIEVLGEKTIPDWIELLPTTEKIGEYYKISDMFLTPSRDEGLVYAIPEAIYCDCPAIRSDLSTMDYELPNDFVVSVDDIDSLRCKIEYMINNLLGTEKLKNILLEQKTYVIKNFSINSWSKEILSLYKKYL